MSAAEVTELGPIDYLLVEWRDQQPRGEALPHLIELVERGIIRILDLSFMTKNEDGEVVVLAAADAEAVEGLEDMLGFASGLLSEEDLEDAAGVLEPGTSAGLIVFENSWAAPFASAVRANGGELVASGRIPVQALIEALEQAEANA
jgi:hypothetical protein